MAGLKEIRSRIRSVTNTKKITYAMKLVSATKLRKAQQAVSSSREYSNALQTLLSNIVAEKSGKDLQHPLMETRTEVKRVRVYVVGGNRGLCGGYNTNVDRETVRFMKAMKAKAEVELVLLGKKPTEHAHKRDLKITKHFDELGEYPVTWEIPQLCKELEVDFIESKIDEVYLIYTHFKSAMSMQAVTEKLLPVEGIEDSTAAPTGLTIFKPAPEIVFEALIPRMVRTKFFQACLDAKASEYGSRMTAMDSATKNAGELMENLRLRANKLRQSSITGEILDIVGGAKALE